MGSKNAVYTFTLVFSPTPKKHSQHSQQCVWLSELRKNLLIVFLLTCNEIQRTYVL